MTSANVRNLTLTKRKMSTFCADVPFAGLSMAPLASYTLPPF